MGYGQAENVDALIDESTGAELGMCLRLVVDALCVEIDDI